MQKAQQLIDISTHSLTRRLTEIWFWISISLLYFNSQPHKEADNVPESTGHSSRNFNSQPHKEADDEMAICMESVDIFQLTASQGG